MSFDGAIVEPTVQPTVQPTVLVLADKSAGDWSTVTLELLGDAELLANKVGWTVKVMVFAAPGAVRDEDARKLAAHGAKEVHVWEHEKFGPVLVPAQYTHTLRSYLDESMPRLILCPSTPLWVEGVAAAVAPYGALVASDCVSVKLNVRSDLELVRNYWNQKTHATWTFSGQRPWVVCLHPGVAGVGRPNPALSAPVERHQAIVLEENVETLEWFPPHPSRLDLVEAERVVAGGRGIGGPEGFAELTQLAELLHAAVGASRVAVDLGWIPYSRQVGQTGKTVRPRLYMAFGISGASQHLDGMRDAETVVAVNLDKEAAIFSVAELGLVGDARAVIEELVRLLKPSERAEGARAGAAAALSNV
ncbi:MAG: electron transfer flavoprotein subunit alpha/FixB family protein [Alicyclobacillaceae bacterium]|nr:electron transfer flavoprotein subunit alpha/FixB family protein [Alicyclobacillaceae bacterium]